MKLRFLLAAIWLGSALGANAQLTIPSDGSDGAFSPTENVVVDLSKAKTGVWNDAGSGDGVYDPQKWAVVYGAPNCQDSFWAGIRWLIGATD